MLQIDIDIINEVFSEIYEKIDEMIETKNKTFISYIEPHLEVSIFERKGSNGFATYISELYDNNDIEIIKSNYGIILYKYKNHYIIIWYNSIGVKIGIKIFEDYNKEIEYYNKK